MTEPEGFTKAKLLRWLWKMGLSCLLTFGPLLVAFVWFLLTRYHPPHI